VYARARGSPIEAPAVGFRNNTTPLTSTYYNTLINPTLTTYYNCNKEGYFTLSCPELKDIGDIKEIEEEEISNKLGKEEP